VASVVQSAMTTDPFQHAEQLHRAGKFGEAIAAYRAALASNPDNAQGHNNLANALYASGQVDTAIGSFRQALKLLPNSSVVLFNLGSVLSGAGRFDEAIAVLRRALALKPGDPDIQNNLANALTAAGKTSEAIPLLRQAVATRPGDERLVLNLANTLRAHGEINEPIELYRRAIELKPNWPEPYNNMGIALTERGELDAGIAAIRKAVEIAPDFLAADSNLVFLIQFHPDFNSQGIYDELDRWNRQHAAKLSANVRAHDNERNADRPLRIGFVSPDFRKHCQSFFTIPLLANLDRGKFEVYCYSGVEQPDETTEQIRKLVGVWRDCLGKSDAAAAEMIRADRIDILVDLTMHMGGGRPLVFARKPAPAQACWLAYPGSTGISAIDYRISDPYLDPPGGKYVEETVQLPDTFWCYDPASDDPAVNSLPALKNAYVTFGCLNAPRKINDRTLELWSSVLAAVPGSRLIVLFPPGPRRRELVEKLGADAARVEFVAHQPRSRYLETYHRIDIGLDTTPYNGHTTSLDSFWMGVPVITRVGNTVVGRAGWSQLNNLKLTELAATSDGDFVRLAADLSGDPPRLSDLRAGLRGRMKNSPLMDGPRFARNMERVFGKMWLKWCKEP
jgi:protein O-GlcNAc transferase